MMSASRRRARRSGLPSSGCWDVPKTTCSALYGDWKGWYQSAEAWKTAGDVRDERPDVIGSAVGHQLIVVSCWADPDQERHLRSRSVISQYAARMIAAAVANELR
jgi:hypothetical protein